MNSTDNATTLFYTKESFLVGLVFVVFSYIAILLSFFGNSLVIIAVKKNIGGNMNTTNNYLLLNLSVTDFMMSVVSFLSVTATVAFNGSFLMIEWPLQGVLGNVTCKAYYFSVVTLYLVSIVIILAISMDRACAIFFPLKTFIDKGVARVIVVLAWIVLSLFGSHTFYFCRIETIAGHTICLYDYTDEKLLAIYILYDGLLLVSFLVLLLLYTMIVVKLWCRTIPGQQCTDVQHRRKKMNRKVTVMLVILVLAFYTCNLPAWLHDMYFAGVSDESSWNNRSFSQLGAYFLMISYGSINPYIIIIFIPKFREASKIVVKKMFPCRKYAVPANVHRNWDRRKNAFHIDNSRVSTESQVAGIENQSIQLKLYSAGL